MTGDDDALLPTGPSWYTLCSQLSPPSTSSKGSSVKGLTHLARAPAKARMVLLGARSPSGACRIWPLPAVPAHMSVTTPV